MTRVDQVSSEESAPAAELDDLAVALAHRRQQAEHPGRTFVRVEAEPEMVDQREVAAVVGDVGLGHPVILAPDLTTVDAGRRGARGESRTPTPFRAPDPKSGASAVPPLSRWLKL